MKSADERFKLVKETYLPEEAAAEREEELSKLAREKENELEAERRRLAYQLLFEKNKKAKERRNVILGLLTRGKHDGEGNNFTLGQGQDDNIVYNNIIYYMLYFGGIFILIAQLLYGIYLITNLLIYRMREERLMLNRVITCESVVDDVGEEGLVYTYVFIHMPLTLLLLLFLKSESMSPAPVFTAWSLSLCLVLAYLTYSHTHSLATLNGEEGIHKRLLKHIIFIYVAAFVSFLTLFLMHLSLRTPPPGENSSKSRMINDEMRAKDADIGQLRVESILWGGRVQGRRLLSKLKEEGRDLERAREKDFEFNLNEALDSFGQVHGLETFKIFKYLSAEIKRERAELYKEEKEEQ